jgi:uncharacterized protein
MLFEVYAKRLEDGDEAVFLYDNTTNTLSVKESGFVFQQPERPIFDHLVETRPFDQDNPLKKQKLITTLKIQLGLSCNYSCSYCSQKFVERPDETSKKDIDAFLAKLDVLEFDEEKGLKIEFWGGEPLVYWKTMKPLAEALDEKFENWKKKPNFSVITNGSLLTREICSWLYYMGFSVGISHDGPGQYVRGIDPLTDPEKRKIILDFYKVMRPQNRISFNTMMNQQNTSRRAVYDWFVELTNDPNVVLGEGTLIDAYDADGINNSFFTLEQHFNYRKQSFNDIYSSEQLIGFSGIYDKIDNFTKSMLVHFETKYLGQKCGMDDENTIAVDLVGNVVTCQNVSVKELSKNLQPHFGGNLVDFENVELKSVTHWKNRANCKDCPVLQLCKGSCMYLDNEYWDITCDTAYTDNVPLFALSIEKITNYIPYMIKADNLPIERQDIWGELYEHKNKDRTTVTPVKIIQEKVASIDGVEVYGQAKTEGWLAKSQRNIS